MKRGTLPWALAALLGIVLTAGVTWTASQLVNQRIGLSSEPLSLASGLAPQHASAPPVSHATVRRPPRPALAVARPSSPPRPAPAPARARARAPQASRSPTAAPSGRAGTTPTPASSGRAPGLSAAGAGAAAPSSPGGEGILGSSQRRGGNDGSSGADD